jgi:hypothetical protein
VVLRCFACLEVAAVDAVAYLDDVTLQPPSLPDRGVDEPGTRRTYVIDPLCELTLEPSVVLQ